MDEKGLYKFLSLRKGAELEDDYPFWLQVALSISLLFFIVIFLFVKGLKIQAYEKKVENVIQVEEMPELQEIEEPPPPPPKPKVQVEVAEAGEGEEEETEEVDIEPTTEFDEFEVPPPPKTEETFQFYEVSEPPKLVSYVQPEYPEMARKAGIEGRVIVQVIVDENGNVVPGSARIIMSTNEIFNQAAIAAAYKCKFKPGKMGDRNVRVYMNIPFTFKLTK